MRSFLHNFILNKPESVHINELAQFTYGDSQKYWYERAAGGSLTDLTPEQLMRLTPKAQRLMTSSRRDSVFVKTHNKMVANWGVPFITAEETVGAIFMVRNPLDVVISLAHHFGYSLDEAIDFMNNPKAETPEDEHKIPQVYGTWSDHAASWEKFNPVHLHTVRYEDMLLKPAKTFGSVGKFLKLPIKKNRLIKAIKQSSFKVLQAQEKRDGFVEGSDKSQSFFRSGKAGQWKSALNDKQVTRIVDAHYDQMKKHGYLPK
ncbi:MAG: sulfotransferase domain-containing protein [Sneathiella sp.]|nr:sulfotransferase domain-containing protein [Sneathiella sp.]